MGASFWAAVEARDAVIDGDLTRAKERADFLAHESFAALPGRYRFWVGQVQLTAGNAAVAAGDDDAAHWVAELALTCGNCHRYANRDTEGKLPELASPPVAAGEDLHARMHRHMQAADDLWMGLARPSDAAWNRGARLLNEAPPEPPVREGEAVDPRVTEQLNQIKALGLRAITASTPHQRADVYGEFLARCPRCHVLVAR
ncbi:MAG TPA: hypothetical protein VF331_20245 [Polyangiales bacterium]